MITLSKLLPSSAALKLKTGTFQIHRYLVIPLYTLAYIRLERFIQSPLNTALHPLQSQLTSSKMSNKKPINPKKPKKQNGDSMVILGF